MAHEISNGGIQRIMVRQPAWHRLGHVVGDSFDWLDAVAQEMVITLPLSKVPMSELILGYQAQDDEYGIVRSDGVVLKCGVGSQQTIFHPELAFGFGAEIIDQTGVAKLDSLGVIRRDRQYFMTYDMGEVRIGEHEIRNTLTIAGSFDGSLALTALDTATIVVCANTLAMALKGEVVHRFKHTSGIVDRVAWATDAISKNRTTSDELQNVGNALVATSVSGQDFDSIMNSLFPLGDEVSKKAETQHLAARQGIRQVYEATEGIDLMLGSQGTAWGVVQAVNTYENWGGPLRKSKEVAIADARALRQFDQALTGKQPLTQRTVKMLLPA